MSVGDTISQVANIWAFGLDLTVVDTRVKYLSHPHHQKQKNKKQKKSADWRSRLDYGDIIYLRAAVALHWLEEYFPNPHAHLHMYCITLF